MARVRTNFLFLVHFSFQARPQQLKDQETKILEDYRKVTQSILTGQISLYALGWRETARKIE